jgi:arginyl-tRNA synthetase
MATDASAAQLSQLLEKLSVGKLNFPAGSNPNGNPIDVYRAHITELVHQVSGVDPAIILPAIQWTNQLENGDLQLPIPALRVKGKKPAELSEEWLAKVRLCPPLSTMRRPASLTLLLFSSPSPRWSKSPRP